MRIDQRIVWLLALVVLLIVGGWALDHVLFPTLPMPEGAPAITK